jgi:hypothetical protein
MPAFCRYCFKTICRSYPPPVKNIKREHMKNYQYFLLALCFISSISSANTGASHCMGGADGKAIACGGKATACQISADGKEVACGGLASSCLISADGKNVACGGEAVACQLSADGMNIACGGQAAMCQTSADGKKVACGGEKISKQAQLP